jgi:tricorn protease
MLYRPKWSPDGKSIVFTDKDGRLLEVTVADRKVKEIAHDTKGGIADYTWSPRGNFLAFSMNSSNGFSSLYIASPDGQVHHVSSENFNAGEPTTNSPPSFPIANSITPPRGKPGSMPSRCART